MLIKTEEISMYSLDQYHNLLAELKGIKKRKTIFNIIVNTKSFIYNFI